MTFILRLFNLLLKIPGFFPFYLWLKFTIYRRKSPKYYNNPDLQSSKIEDRSVIVKYEAQKVKFKGNEIGIRGYFNDVLWEPTLLESMDYNQPETSDGVGINFQPIKLEISDNEFRFNDLIKIQYQTSEQWTKLIIYHEMNKVYGMGEKNGSLDKSSKVWKFWNIDNSSLEPSDDPLYKSYPSTILTDGNKWITLVVDYPGYQYWDLKSEGKLSIEIESIQFIIDLAVHNHPKDALKYLLKILGPMPLPPIWALGYHQSRWSYHPTSEVLRVASTLRKHNIPCDAIYLDIDYMEGYRCFTWDEDKFGDFPSLIHDLHDMDFKVIPMIDPGIKVDLEYSVYKDGLEKGVFLQLADKEYRDKVWPGLCAFPDFFRKDVQEWWKDLHRNFVQLGIDGFFNDMNEISVFNLRGTMPDEVIHSINNTNVEHFKVHNLYSQMMAKASYEGLKSLYGQKRVFLLIRSGYLGSQKYGFIWTGDNKSDWDHLRQSIPKLLNSGLSGHFANGADVGGFRDNAKPELFVRWLQLSVFYPFLRNHTAIGTTDQEPWVFGTEVLEISRKFINLRYTLLPYFYTWFVYAARIGIPFLRPLWMENPNDRLCYDSKWENTQFYCGPDLLIAPILEKDSRYRELYLPEGTWYHYFTKTPYEGGRIVTISAALNEMIILVKEGTILPEYSKVGKNTSDTTKSEIMYKTFGKAKIGYLYKDDGLTNEYITGSHEWLRIKDNFELIPIDESEIEKE